MKALLIALLIAVAIFTGASAARAGVPSSTEGGGGGGFPVCNAAHAGWYDNPGYGQWWVCGYSAYYGWIWVPA